MSSFQLLSLDLDDTQWDSEPVLRRVYRLAAGVAPALVVHVGDQPYYDIEAAHRAGITCVWINRGGNVWPEGMRPADAVIRLFTELPAALDAIRRRRVAS